MKAEQRSRLVASAKRIALLFAALAVILMPAYAFWQPGLVVKDGRHDRKQNAIWLSHGWLGHDDWFTQYGKVPELQSYRSPAKIAALFERMRTHHIGDVFPHLCPVSTIGLLPAVDSAQVERFLDHADGMRVIPWIGGPRQTNALIENAAWRSTFATSVRELLIAHPRLAGVHLNIEPLRTGDADFLTLLDQLRSVLPPGKILSVAAYPPPTRWHPFPDVHWEESYFRQVAHRCDQLAVMTYDAGQRLPKTFQKLMADWTEEILAWSEGKPVLLGVPTYDDTGVGYHHPDVENIANAISGIHRGLQNAGFPPAFQGIAIYCDWETTEPEWTWLRENFSAPAAPR